jgi:hypothetical protein
MALIISLAISQKDLSRLCSQSTEIAKTEKKSEKRSTNKAAKPHPLWL